MKKLIPLLCCISIWGSPCHNYAQTCEDPKPFAALDSLQRMIESHTFSHPAGMFDSLYNLGVYIANESYANKEGLIAHENAFSIA